MSDPTADYLVDRRSLRRKLTFWRVAIVAAAIVVLVAAWRIGGASNHFGRHIARVDLQGVITGDRGTLKLLDDIAKSSSAEAVILSIQSPGGTTSGSEALYQALRRLSAKKPTVAVVRSMAASGAYIAALGTDHIVAEGNSLVGSIGVLFQFPNVSKLLGTIGVSMEEVKSSPLKAAPNGLVPTSPEARAALASLVSDSFDWFKGLVKNRRGMSDEELARVADGRVFTGRQGLALKLVDEIGEERAAVHWLESGRGIDSNLPVRDWKAGRSLERLGLFGVSAGIAEDLGFGGLGHLLRQVGTARESASLDGLVALWQVDPGSLNQ